MEGRAAPGRVGGGSAVVTAQPALCAAKPGHHFLGVLVRREYRIEHFGDGAVVDDERDALEQRHPRGREVRQLDRARELEVLVREHRKRQMQTLDRLALIGGVLRREAEKPGDAERLELGVMVAETAGLRRAAARPGELIPT